MNTSAMIFRILIASTLLLSTGACTKFIEFEGEDATPRLVVNGVFSPDSVFEIEMSNSLGFIDVAQIAPRTDGRAVVYDASSNLIDSLVHVGDGIYRGTSAATVGNTYTVRASAGRFDEVYATDILPLPVPVDSWDTASAESSDPFLGNGSLDIFFTLTDPADRDNYYMVEIFQSPGYYIDYVFNPVTEQFEPDTIFFDGPPTRQYMSTSDQVLQIEANEFSDGGEQFGSVFFFTDRLFSGETRRFQVRLDYYAGYSDIEIRLTSASRGYWRYMRTIDRYDYSSGDPFSEPVQIYTNIEGGLGIWAGYSVSSATIE